jgi:3-deoxy-D-manno-octulosonic-acid transferase
MLSRLYHYADITYVGGGFGDDGVHNVLEAAVYGKPVIYGPEFEKFIEAIELEACGGGISITNALELEKVLKELWSNDQLLKNTGDAAKNYVYKNSGASGKIMAFIQENRLLIN